MTSVVSSIERSDLRSTMQQYIMRLELNSPRMRTLMRAVCFNFFVLFCRPQDWPGLSFIGKAKLPLLFSILVVVMWMPVFGKSMHKITKYMIAFLGFEALRGVLGFFIFEDFVLNDAKQMYTWIDLLLQFLSLAFPIVAAMQSQRTMKMLATTCCLSASLLGLYALTHSGKGPGGFVGDENDVCLVLVMLLPFCVVLRRTFGGAFFSMFALGSAGLTCAGIVATNSRGGFLGFAAVLGLIFLRSDRKVLTLVAGAAVFLMALPFVPQEYIQEITSIKKEAGTGKGTMQERLDTWEVATRVFLDPRNIVLGVGLNNVPHRFHEYEDVGRGRYVKSLSGRAMHSMYFSLLPDLGLYGVFIIGSIWYFSLRGLFRGIKQYETLHQRLGNVGSLLAQSAKQHEGEPAKGNYEEELNTYRIRLMQQGRIGRDYCRCLIVAWAGTLVAGIGVSVLYYPPVWFLVGCSAAMQLHVITLSRGGITLIEATESLR